LSDITEVSVINEQYVQLLQRQSFRDFNNGTSCAASALTTANSTGVAVPLKMGQAIRFVSLDVQISTSYTGTDLFIANACIFAASNVSGVKQVYPWQGALTNAGQSTAIHWNVNELWYWNDYLEQGTPVTTIDVQCFVDVVNKAAVAAQTVNVAGIYIVETYILKPTGTVGFAT
jgi:hypothetical protein